MLMTIEEHSTGNAVRIDTSLCPSESSGPRQTIRTTLLEDGKIVASAPIASKVALRALTDEWGLQISGMSGQNLVDHARALDTALRSVYGSMEDGATGSLHLMNLVLVRQDRFFVAHLGASDVYLIRDRKVHPLALAPSLRSLEQSLGFEFESTSKLEPERVACGAFSWPDLPVMNLVSSGYKPGDYLLFTSPGLFEQRDWPGILGSLARSGTPFEQAAVRLARVGHARLRTDSDGYLLTQIAGPVVAPPVQAPAPSAEDSQSLKMAPPIVLDETAHKALSHQLEYPSAMGPSRTSGSPVGVGAAIVCALLLGLLLLTPYFRNATSRNAATNKPGNRLATERSDSKESRTKRDPKPTAAASIATGRAATEAPAVPPAVDAPIPQVVTTPETAAAHAPRGAEFLAMETGAEGNPFAAGAQLARDAKYRESTDYFYALLTERNKAFTIQVGVVTKPETVRSFFKNAGDETPLILLQGKDRAYLTVGLFDSESDAWMAVQKLPEFFRKQNAVVKPVSRILADLPELRPKPTPKPKPTAPH